MFIIDFRCFGSARGSNDKIRFSRFREIWLHFSRSFRKSKNDKRKTEL